MTLSDLIVMVADAFDLTVADVRTRTKRRDIIAARAAYGELARRYTPHSSKVIADLINTRAETVSRGWKTFPPRLRDPGFAERFGRLDEALRPQLPLQPERVRTAPKPWLKGKVKTRFISPGVKWIPPQPREASHETR